MQNELSPYSTDYFDKVQYQIKTIHKELQAKDRLMQQRNKFYQKSLKSYENYIDKQTKVLNKNIDHCQNRDKWFKQQVSKAWRTSIANRSIVLRSLARTNISKRQADQWIARMQDEVLGGRITNYQQQQRNNMNNSQLLNRYNDILNQYQFR